MTTRIIRRSTRTSLEHTDSLKYHPILQRVYANRGIKSQIELERSTRHLLPIDLLSGIEKAVLLLSSALQKQERILIVGDYDADGATSTAVAIKSLRNMGAEHVDFLVPNRLREGYGLTPEIVKLASPKKPDLIITVDNGISSLEGVLEAKSRNIKVCITDHHLPGPNLPEADAIVNPNLRQDTFPSKNLSGVGVIFYVMMALRRALRREGWFEKIKEPNLAALLDLVALGTVADVVPLDANNRILVYQGIQRIKSGTASLGIMALLKVAGKDYRKITAADLGFIVGPRLNAAGRLDDMSLGITCLLSESPQESHELAAQLDKLNRERRDIESQMQADALTLLSDFMRTQTFEALPLGLCVFQEDWHSGVIGILASRLKEQFHRPVIAFAPGNGDELKGSARSIPGVHIRDVLQTLATLHPHLMHKFGGHAMAAGLSLSRAHFAEFCEKFNEILKNVISPELLEQVILTDGALESDDFSLELAQSLADAGPFGQGFPEPQFDGIFKIEDSRVVGEKHLKMRVSIPNTRSVLDAIAFNFDFTKLDLMHKPVQLVYKLNVNEYNGKKQMQLLVDEILPGTLPG